MHVRELLQSKKGALFTASPAMAIRRAMALMVEHQISCLPVLDENDHLMGIISDKDIFRAVHERTVGFDSLTVGNLMTTDLIVGCETDEIGYIAGIMTNNRVRHVPIVEGNRLVGLLSVGDIVKTQMTHYEVENRYLWQYINGGYPG